MAIRAIFKAVTAGKQVALLAPTTILTQQHYHTIKERLRKLKDALERLETYEMVTEQKCHIHFI